MRNLNFYQLKAKNVLCFGKEGVELFFKDYGSTVLVLGENLDDSDSEGKPASNGAGKSTLIELMVLGLFGKTVKSPKKMSIKDVLNRKIKENAEIEIVWDNYRVVRRFEPNSLKVWESKDKIWTDDTEVTKGKSKIATQEFIEEKLGLNYETFVNIVIFDYKFAFLEADTPTRRSIVENLLCLQVYSNYCETAKELQKDLKNEIKNLGSKYDIISGVIKEYEKKIELNKSNDLTWNKNLNTKIQILEKEIKEKQDKLQQSDVSKELAAYDSAVAEIEDITSSKIPELNTKKETYVNALNDALAKLADYKSKHEEKKSEVFKSSNYINQLELKISESSKLLKKIGNLSEGEKCPSCYGVVNESNYANILANTQQSIDEIQLELNKNKESHSNLQEAFKALDAQVKKLEDIIKKIEQSTDQVNNKIVEYQRKISNLSKVKKPDLSVEIQLIEQSIVDNKKNLEDKRNELLGGSPYKSLIDDSVRCLGEKVDELDKIEKQTKENEDKLKYVMYWTKGFGDEGIRRLIIFQIIPALNSRIAYLLQYLVDNKITLTFDDSLNATIQRNPADGDPFVYHAMSSGEKQKLNLAVSQAFAYIMNLSTGTCPSFVFFDEIATNVDANSIVGVYNMLTELSKERQVFVTTHNAHLLNMMQGCETIRVRKKDGFSKIVR